MFDQLEKIWYIYYENAFYKKSSKLSLMLEWEVQIEKLSPFDTRVSKLFKDHIMIKGNDAHGIYSICDSYSIYLAENINDPDPVLIYYCYPKCSARQTPNGWVNIGYWSLFTKKLIDDSIKIINNFRQDEAFNRYIEKEEEFTKDIKPNLHKFFEEEVTSFDYDTFLKLTEDILKDKELNEYTRLKDRENANEVMNKLVGEN